MAIGKGYKFNLKEEEIMKCLLNKVTGASWLGWCCDQDIEWVDLYGDKEPWVVFGNRGEGEKERYFFTPLKGVGKDGKSEQRVCRSVGKFGSWSNKGQKALIFGRKGGLIGHKRGFKYEVKKKGDSNSDSEYDWLLKEYVLSDIAKRRVKRKYAAGANCALCVLKRRRKTKRESPVVEEEEESDADPDEWLRQEFGSVDDDDDARGASSSSLQQSVLPMEDSSSCGLQQVSELDKSTVIEGSIPYVDDRSLCVPPVEETRGLPFLPMEDSSSSCGLQQVSEWLIEDDQLDKSPVIEGSIPNEDEYWSIPVEECSAPPPPVDCLSEGGFAFCSEDSNHHFACWDDSDLFPIIDFLGPSACFPFLCFEPDVTSLFV